MRSPTCSPTLTDSSPIPLPAPKGASFWTLLLAGPALWLVVAVDDAMLIPRAPGYLGLALLDEPAHLATTLIGLLGVSLAFPGNPPRPWRWFAAGAIVAGNLIDIDHVPQMLGHDFLTAGTPRPYSHSLATVLTLLVLAGAANGRVRPVFAGASFGVLLHLFRDMATGQVSLFWPLTKEPMHLAYPVYAGALGAVVLVAAGTRALSFLVRLRRRRTPTG
jgi:membrane-bound metal-dependent hydrolase YbcI (DUF457 family)